MQCSLDQYASHGNGTLLVTNAEVCSHVLVVHESEVGFCVMI